MRDAIQGMLSMSRGSRLLPGTSLLRTHSSTEASQFVRRRSSLSAADDIDKKLMSCYNDSEFGMSWLCCRVGVDRLFHSKPCNIDFMPSGTHQLRSH